MTLFFLQFENLANGNTIAVGPYLEPSHALSLIDVSEVISGFKENFKAYLKEMIPDPNEFGNWIEIQTVRIVTFNNGIITVE
jgi:hypothetical protein